MKYEQYTALIQKLEKFAQENPKGYERRVAWLGRLGYGYFIGLIALFLILPLGLIVLLIVMPKLIWIALKALGKIFLPLLVGLAAAAGFVGRAVKSLWMKIPEPEGIEIARATAPALYETVEKTSDFLKAPRPDKIIMVEDFNAAVVTQPGRGVFGRKIFLMLGLPLMQALSPEQLEAVIAHEIGHVSERHGKHAARAYRLHEIWGRFIEAQEVNGTGFSFLYEKFLNWYFPYFNAYSFVLCRRQECDADDYAVRLNGARALGEALINLEVKNRSVTKALQKDIFDEAAREKNPPRELFTRMAQAFRESNKPQELMSLSKAVAVNTDYSDTHPSLGARLKRMGYWNGEDLPALPAPVVTSAAQHYLGAREKEFLDVFNNLWLERVGEQWRQRHDYLLEAEKKIAEYNRAETELSDDQMYDRAGLISERYGNAAATESLRELLARNPEHVGANYTLGTILLGEDDDRGIELLEKAMRADRTLKIPGCEAIYYYLRGKGADEEARKYILTIENERENVDLATRERSGVMPVDKFAAHDVPAEIVGKIAAKLKYYDEISAAYLAHKVVNYYAEFPLRVMFFETRKPKLLGGEKLLKTDELLKVMAERLSEFDIHYFVVFDNSYAEVKKELAGTPGALIYRREV